MDRGQLTWPTEENYTDITVPTGDACPFIPECPSLEVFPRAGIKFRQGTINTDLVMKPGAIRVQPSKAAPLNLPLERTGWLAGSPEYSSLQITFLFPKLCVYRVGGVEERFD